MVARGLVSKSGIKTPGLSSAANAVKKVTSSVPNPANVVQKLAGVTNPANVVQKLAGVPGANAVQKLAGVSNPANVVQKLAGVPGANAVQKLAGVSTANAPFKNVSLSNVLPKAEDSVQNESPANDNGWEVTLIRIYTVMVKALFTLIVFTWNTLYWIFTTLISFLITLIGFICRFLAYMFIPCVVFIVVYFTVGSFWDGGMKPMLEVIMMGINGIVEIWNSVVRGLRSFGIPIDTASGFSQGFPTFWEFIKNIFVMVGKLIESSLKGVIFR